jgi:hypothetical protein
MQWFRAVYKANDAARDAFHLIQAFKHDPDAWEGRQEERHNIVEKWRECFMTCRSCGMDVWIVAEGALTEKEY